MEKNDPAGVDRLTSLLDAARADRERMDGALEHIVNVCKGSRQYTRRIRWIESRAESARVGNDDWRAVDLPKFDPGMERLQNMVVSIYAIVLDEIAARRDVYEDDDGVVGDQQIGRELELLERFAKDARANIQVIREMEERLENKQVRTG